jgi:PAS domain S-box-containing protein
MGVQSFSYIAPYLASAAISSGVGIYAWRRRAVAGAQEFAVVALSQAFWTVAYALELASPSLDAKIFWDNLQFVGFLVAPTAFLIFALQFTERKLDHPRRILGLLSIVPVISLLLVFSDSQHGLVRPEAWVVPGDSFSVLVYDFSATFLAMAIYVYALLLAAIVVLINKYRQRRRLYRAQIGMVLIAAFIPAAGGVMTIAGLTPILYRDVTPLTFALSNLIVAWGLFRYRLFDIVPVARDAVIESMSDAVVVVDVQNRVIDLNPAAQAMFGRPASEVIGDHVADAYSEWRHLVEQFQDVEEVHTRISVDTELGERHFDLRLSSLLDRRESPSGRVLVVRDITDLIDAEQEIEKRTRQLEIANEQLESANENLKVLSQAKDEFVSNVSHELRTPITNLKLYLDLLAQRPEQSERYQDVLNRETERLENMIQGLLTLSRLDQDRLRMRPEKIDLNDLAQEYVKDRTALAEGRGLTLQADVNSNVPAVSADRNLMGQVLSILLTNALSYTPEGGRVVVSTHHNQYDGKPWCGISVSDTGPGIHPEELDQLFSRFFRGEIGRQSNVPGTGLGLAIVKEIVERHHGRVEVESEGVAGKGATFTVWLPAA